jgi:hypothetical protein
MAATWIPMAITFKNIMTILMEPRPGVSVKNFFRRNFQMLVMMYSVCPWQAFPAWCLYRKTYYSRNLRISVKS